MQTKYFSLVNAYILNKIIFLTKKRGFVSFEAQKFFKACEIARMIEATEDGLNEAQNEENKTVSAIGYCEMLYQKFR